MNFPIDPHRSWLRLFEAAGTAKDPRSNLLRLVGAHMEAEIKGQLDPLMATLSDEPVYHMWNQSAPMVLRGAETIAGLYREMFAVGAQQFEFVIERLVADEHHVVTEGHLKQVHTAQSLIDQGVTDVAGQSVSDHPLWLSDAQLVVLWPADSDGRILGEDTYFGEDPMATLEPIQASDLPPYFNIHEQSE